MLTRQMPITADQQKIAREISLYNFMLTLTTRGKQVFNERMWAFNALPKDPKFIKCTFIPKEDEGWDLTEKEALQFINLFGGTVTSIQHQENLKYPMYETDKYNYIWIGFK